MQKYYEHVYILLLFLQNIKGFILGNDMFLIGKFTYIFIFVFKVDKTKSFEFIKLYFT